MRELKAAVVIALAGLLFYASAMAKAQQYQPTDQTSPQQSACFPACQIGYACNQGVCISLCNPPCGPAEVCTAAGQCLVPVAPPPPAGAPPPAEYTIERPSWFRWGYGHIGGILSPYGVGSATNDSLNADLDLTSKFSGGLCLSGYWAASTSFQLGAYFNYLKGKIEGKSGSDSAEFDAEHFGFGVSIKAGGQVGDRVWLGFVGDLGYYKLDLSFETLSNSYEGIEISPRFHMDVLVVRSGEFKMGLFATLGPSIVPYIKSDNVHIWLITVQLRLGLTFGA